MTGVLEQGPRILLVWGYHRRGWIAPFEQLGEQFDFRYLFYCTKEEEEADGSATARPRYYWDDFSDAQEVLEVVRPSRIVFMGLFGVRTIALNMTARRAKIPTIFFQHGYCDSLANFLANPTIANTGANRGGQRSRTRRGLTFLLKSSLLTDPVDTLRAVAMLAASRRIGQWRSQMKFRFAGRIPDLYLTYSPRTSDLHRELDGATEEQILSVGMPEFDAFFRAFEERTMPPGKNVLLLDSPNAGNRYGTGIVSTSEKARFFEQVFEDLRQLGYSLTIKLHPETYAATWLPLESEISYVREGNVIELIGQASACLGFESTLVIPAIYARPSMLFRLRRSTLIDTAEKLGVAKVVDGLDYSRGDLERLIRTSERDSASLQEFVRQFALAADGRATERLAAALRAPSASSVR